MLDLAGSLLAISIVLLSAFGVGRLLWRRLAVEQGDLLAIVVWSSTLGLLALGCGFTLLGFAGWLTAPVLGVVTIVGSIWGLGELTCWVLAWRYALAIRRYTSPRPTENTDRDLWEPSTPSLAMRTLLSVVAGCVLISTLLGALAPPLADEALTGSLQIAKDFLLSGGIHAGPNEPATAGPLLCQMWYAWAMALDGPVAAGLLQWSLGILLALAAGQLASLVIGRAWMWVASAVVVLTPGVAWQSSVPLDDLALALFVTLAIVAWWRAVIEVDGPRWYWICGLMLGGALGTKAVAVILLPTFGLVWLGMYLRHVEQREQLLDGWLAFLAAVCASAGFWYLRCWWLGGTALAAVEQPANFQHLGPLLLSAVPAVAVCRKLRGLSLLLSIAALYSLACLAVCPQVRWWSPIVPLLAVAAVWTSMELVRFPRLPRYLTQTAWMACLMAMAVEQLWTLPEHAPVALGWQHRDDYLRERQASYGAALVANQLAKPGARVLSQDPHGLYFGCEVTNENIYRSQTSYHLQLSEPSEVSRCLRAAGFSHVLLVDKGEKESRVNSPLNRMIDAQLADPSNSGVLQLADYRFTSADRAPRRYRLLMLR